MGPRAAFCLIVATLAVPAAGAVDEHSWAAATTTQGRRFRVRTNTWPALARDLVATLDRAHTLFRARFGPLSPDRARPMQVDLYRSERDYYRRGGGVHGAVGHFDAVLDRCALVWDGEPEGRGWPVAVHEACHHYLWRLHPHLSLPGWYAEGICCYFEGLLDDATPGSVARMRVRAARSALEAGQADLELLLRARVRVRKGRLSITNLSAVRFYGLAWSLCHFLARDPAYRARFRRFETRLFATRLHADRAELQARRILREECGPLADLERAWRDHIRSLPAARRKAPVRAGSLDDLGADDPLRRYRVLHALRGAQLGPDLREHVAARLEDPDLLVRLAAARALAGSPGPGAKPLIERSLATQTPEVRPHLLRALGRTAPKVIEDLLDEAQRNEPVHKLRSLLDDPAASLEQKVRACVALGKRRDRAAVAALRRLCRPRVADRLRLEAVRALVRITGERRGYRPGQPAREREAVFRAWAD